VSDPMGRAWLWHNSRLEQQEVILLERAIGAAESAMARDKVPRATSCELRGTFARHLGRGTGWAG
jgi:hypothetical protein